MRAFLKKKIKIDHLRNSETTWIRNAFKRVIALKNGCWKFNGSHSTGGYAWAQVGNGKANRIHRFLRQHIEGRLLSKDEWCCHACNNKWCVNPNHIYLGNRSENTKDMLEDGSLNLIKYWKNNIGEKHTGSVLTVKDVIAIRKLKKEGVGVTFIAKRVGHKLSTVSNIYYNYKKDRWSHVK